MLKALPLVRGRNPGEPRPVAPSPVLSFLPTFTWDSDIPLPAWSYPGPLRAAMSSKSPLLQAKCPIIPVSTSIYLFFVTLCSFFFSISCSALCRESSQAGSSQSEGETPPCPGGAQSLIGESACGGCLPGPLTLGLSVPPLPSPLPPWTLSDTCFWVPWANKSCPDSQEILQAAARLQGGGKQPWPQTWG